MPFALKKNLKLGGFQAIGWFEKNFSAEYKLHYSPTFIVGPPRSGTTLTMQLMTWAIPTCYLTNLTWTTWNTLGYPLPIMTARLAKWLRLTKHPPSFQSEYGYTPGRGRSNEGADLWSYWFGKKYLAVGPEELSADQQRRMYQAIAGTERVFDLPFVNKTIDLCLRIRALVKVFPNALFIQMIRDPLDTAQSIFKARMHDYPDYLSARPKECLDVSDKSVIDQVCEQVYYIDKSIACERSIVGQDRFLFTSYKDVCENPLLEMEKIAGFMNDRGAPAHIARPIPDAFRYSHGRKIDPDAYAAMSAYLEELYSQDDSLRQKVLEPYHQNQIHKTAEMVQSPQSES